MRCLMLFVLGLTACAAPRSEFHQAAVPPPMPAPAPSFPRPGFTPAGAGASHGGLPAPKAPGAERSPNKRALPPDNEPGLWAADPVRAFKADDPPDDGDDPAEDPSGDGLVVTNECRAELYQAAALAKVTALFDGLPEKQQKCVFARLFLFCSNAELKPLQRFPEHVTRMPRWILNDVPAINARAARYAKAACRDVPLSADALTVYGATVARFDDASLLPNLK
jgi:hypothetical protein